MTEEDARDRMAEWDRERARRIGDAWNAVLGSREGRFLVARLVYELCGLRKTLPYQGEALVRAEGRRDVGDAILGEAWQFAPAAYVALEAEWVKAQAEELLARGAIAAETESET